MTMASTYFATSERDLDNDGLQNSQDSCPKAANTGSYAANDANGTGVDPVCAGLTSGNATNCTASPASTGNSNCDFGASGPKAGAAPEQGTAQCGDAIGASEPPANGAGGGNGVNDDPADDSVTDDGCIGDRYQNHQDYCPL